MSRYYLSLIFFLLASTLFCQNQSIEFKDYDQILRDLNLKGQKSEYYQNLDFESMLYLDKRCLKDLLKLDSEFIIKFNLDTLQFSSPGINRNTKYFKTNIKDIRRYFLDQKSKELLNNYLLDQDNDNFESDSPIYVKDSTKAVFSNGNKTYRISLENGQLKTELLSQTIE
jgi:hypothetical protein